MGIFPILVYQIPHLKIKRVTDMVYMLAVLVQNPSTQDSDDDNHHHHCQHYCGTLQDFNTDSVESTVAYRPGVTAYYNNDSACAGHIAPQVVGIA
jgi:hypothetical protein